MVLKQPKKCSPGSEVQRLGLVTSDRMIRKTNPTVAAKTFFFVIGEMDLMLLMKSIEDQRCGHSLLRHVEHPMMFWANVIPAVSSYVLGHVVTQSLRQDAGGSVQWYGARFRNLDDVDGSAASMERSQLRSNALVVGWDPCLHKEAEKSVDA